MSETPDLVRCPDCKVEFKRIDLSPGYEMPAHTRRTSGTVTCPKCGVVKPFHLFENVAPDEPST